MPRGMTLLASVTALAIAASMTLVWLGLWQHQGKLQQVQQWRMSLLELQQAQRDFFRQQQRFAQDQQELITAGLLSYPLDFAGTSPWQFEAQAHNLLMHTELTLASPELLLRDMNSYHWQAPQLTLKVVGYVNP